MWAKEPSYEEGDGRAINETTLGSPKYCSGEKREAGEKGKRQVVETMQRHSADTIRHRILDVEWGIE